MPSDITLAAMALLLSVAGARADAGALFLPPPEGKRPPTVEFAHSPEWFRRCPALYVPTAESAGAGMLTFAGPTTTTLHERIDSFRRLPELLDQAEALGTNTIYLVDFYQGWPGQPRRYFWLNKGDYMPRSDLGGAEALKQGIDAIHARGGRVIVYVEAFIISKRSAVGKAHGLEWSIMTPDGPPVQPYPGHWHMCSACPGWVEYLASVCRRLVAEYGVDGIHVDSYGYQRDWRCVSGEHGHESGKASVFNDGCAELLRRLREAVQGEKADAVVIVEGPMRHALFTHIDGSQDWGIHTLSRRWLWDAAGRTNVFTTGWCLDDIHQILAMGHKLSLGGYWLEAPGGPSCAEWISAALPAELPAPRQKADMLRRYFAECYFRALHKWRNAGLLLGVTMPGVDDLTPRRWLRADFFQSGHALGALMEQVQSRARDLDAALESRDNRPLPAPAEHLRRLLEARRRLSAVIDDGASVQVLGTDAETAAAYLFSSPAGRAVTIVNVGDDRVDMRLALPNGPGQFRDELTDEILTPDEKTVPVTCAPHSLRMLREHRAYSGATPGAATARRSR
ncbi:MAG: DUF6259 domain-containing protein [Armatimonadota bacterium]